jgi:hypothetical protein
MPCAGFDLGQRFRVGAAVPGANTGTKTVIDRLSEHDVPRLRKMRRVAAKPGADTLLMLRWPGDRFGRAELLFN